MPVPVFSYTSINRTPGNGCWLGELVIDVTKHGYRLPTEAEWEYACRAGSATVYYCGDSIDGNYLWYKENSGGLAHAVATRLPNAFGLYDMKGTARRKRLGGRIWL